MEEFDTEDDAIVSTITDSGFRFVENVRFAYIDDSKAMGEYEALQWDSPSGAFDQEVLVGGRIAKVGVSRSL